MNNYFSLLAKDLKKLWGGLEFPQKFTIVLLTVVTFAAIAYFIAKSTEPNWGVLYSDLSETDAVAVIENLKKAGYQYKLSDDKKTILVPVDLKEDLRLMIAENDVIHDSNPGFELLDKVQLGATDFQNKLTRQRIFQGELTRTIERIKGIKKARVQLADPERSIFSEKEELPSASVMLILEPGFRMKPDQVKAIKNLVAYGIPRLTPDRVFLTSQDGTPLSEEINQGGDVSDYRLKFENTISKKVSKVIEKLVGQDNFSVEVSAVMNFDTAKATIERYIPANASQNSPEGVVVSTQSESEAYDNGNPTQAQEGAIPAPAGAKNTNYQKVKSIKNFNISKEIKQIIYAPGTLEKMTIAVALNKILTSKEKDELRNLIVSASGANLERGDIITITGMQFAEAEEQTTEKVLTEIQKTTNMELWVKNIAPMLVVLILGLTALFVFSSLIRKPLQGQEVYSEEAYYDDGEEEPDLLQAASIPAIEAKLEPELERLKSDLNNIILSDPSEAARLLLSYVKD
ncbi:MAG: flagellar M-ring protein FliF [Candidatus Melainabacteria bacterium RIFOXYA12_FULL_32_12]|nr:MAG: flagellar M-ring protein FliF [Candidatus Melainabacteria bacterium RIFOXYA2_FULL_32_9]OGI31374.1 MAG: flagellar M-ring protein FliF [Candidatus Melainabacteria bacterium RIFOXYA12_FULL_32_12]